MRTRRNLLCMLAAAATCGLATTFAAAHEGEHAKVGEPAPAFTLKDTEGKSHKLADFKGKIVVLQWINPGCPYCVRVMSKGPVKEMQKQIHDATKDKPDAQVVFLAVNSTHFMKPEESAAYLKEHKMKGMAALDDRKGKVGHLYGAKTTPHMYVIDQKGILRYHGAIDDDKYGKNPGKSTNYVVNAVMQIVAGETVTPDFVKPYGCSVKFKK